MSVLKRAIIASLSRIPSNMSVLVPALDKLSEQEQKALLEALSRLDNQMSFYKRKVRRGF